MIVHYSLLCVMCMVLIESGFFLFKQKTAYEMRISDWSSDVCSSDRDRGAGRQHAADHDAQPRGIGRIGEAQRLGQPACLVELDVHPVKIGRASCRESVCQYV